MRRDYPRLASVRWENFVGAIALFFLLETLQAQPAEAGQWNVRDFGAVGDGISLDTEAFNRAIAQAHAAGGGVIVVPAGNYLCGTIRLFTGCTLRVEKGAVIRQSRDPAHYPARRYLLLAENARDVALVGEGTIVGIGEGPLGRLADRSDAQMPAFRAGIALFENCQNVRVAKVRFELSDTWTLTFRFCEDVLVEEVTIRNEYLHTNSDGIDPVSCRKVRIRGCDIVAGDDCVVLKTADKQPCEDVQVWDCTLETIATAIKIGTESSGDFRNIEFRDCTIRNSTVGIGIYVKDGATVEDVRYRRIQIENYRPQGRFTVENAIFPVFMDIERRHADSPVGKIRSIQLEDVVIRSGFGVLVQGMPESPVEQLTIRNMTFYVKDSWDWSKRRKHIGGRRTLSNQRDTEFARLPGWVVLAHVRGLTVDGLRLVASEEEWKRFPREPLLLRHVEGAITQKVERVVPER
ncbi:MAG: glycosyl hydrolase family 28 protein [Thermoguttaceae bacterium]|nr:glycosyl hydrolase family 28 protein [Thermoguttaceae bacterium]MDW8079577.1 glycosyl hydrolase family 28 protein [Thermoguttaceae bacterium]